MQAGRRLVPPPPCCPHLQQGERTHELANGAAALLGGRARGGAPRQYRACRNRVEGSAAALTIQQVGDRASSFDPGLAS